MMGSMSSFVRAFMAEASHFEAPALAASANSRHLVSRNKREGGYMGKAYGAHQRTGKDQYGSLRDWGCK